MGTQNLVPGTFFHEDFSVLSMNKIRERDELRAPNRWGARFVFSTKTAPIYSLNV